METHHILFIITVPVVTFIFYLIANNLLLTFIVGTVLFAVTLLYVVRNRSRKEVLNVIRSGKTLYFHLSDDQLFSLELKSEEELAELLHRVMDREKQIIDEMVYYINFVNFQNDSLQQELNARLKKAT